MHSTKLKGAKRPSSPADRQTERKRQTDRESDRERKRERERKKETERKRERKTERRREREVERYNEKEREREREREKEGGKCYSINGKEIQRFNNENCDHFFLLLSALSSFPSYKLNPPTLSFVNV